MNTLPVSSFTKMQKYALDTMLSGANVFLTGEAGTGKSEVIKKYIELSEHNEKQLLVMAPTGTAADNIGGQTIHRVFNASIGVQKNTRALNERKDILRAADIVIIDEISMCRFDLFEYVARRIVYENDCRKQDRIKSLVEYLDENEEVKENDIQLIVIGDFYQLPPVMMDEDRKELSAIYNYDFGRGYAFMSPFWKMMGFIGISLKEVVRQEDLAFKHILSEIRKSSRENINACIDFLMRNSSDFPMMGDDSISVIPTNPGCKDFNDKKMAELDTKEVRYFSETEGDIKASEKFADDEIVLKEGCKVMTVINNPSCGYINGTIGRAVKLRKNSIDVLLEGGHVVNVVKETKDIYVPVVKKKTVQKYVDEPVLDEQGNPKKDDDGNVITVKMLRDIVEETIVREKVGTFKQLPIKVAYAITVHKSQGKTFTKVNLDPYAWDPGQFYTALSRVKKIKNVCFVNTIRPEFIITSPEVKKFMKEIEEAQEKIDLKFEL